VTTKQQLIQEIESTPETILTETLNFLRYLKTKDNQLKQKQKTLETQTNTQINSTGRSLLEHLKTIDKWQGDDLEECLEEVVASRGQAKFDYDNPFE
jgi:hypothetical protein